MTFTQCDFYVFTPLKFFGTTGIVFISFWLQITHQKRDTDEKVFSLFVLDSRMAQRMFWKPQNNTGPACSYLKGKKIPVPIGKPNSFKTSLSSMLDVISPKL